MLLGTGVLIPSRPKSAPEGSRVPCPAEITVVKTCTQRRTRRMAKELCGIVGIQKKAFSPTRFCKTVRKNLGENTDWCVCELGTPLGR